MNNQIGICILLRYFVEIDSNYNYFIAILFLILYNDNHLTEMLQNIGGASGILKKTRLS